MDKFRICLVKRIVVEVEADNGVHARYRAKKDDSYAFNQQEWDKAEPEVEWMEVLE